MAPTWTTIALALLATRPEPTLTQAPATSRPTTTDDAPLTAPAPRIRVAILRGDGFIEPNALVQAIRLRLPAVTLVSEGEPVPAAEEGSLRAFIELRHDESQLLLTLILADGRAYLRQLELDADASPRPVASALANLVAAIEDDTAVPDEVKRYPLMRRHHRRADGQLRTTRASVPDGQSANAGNGSHS